jgi:hypothetical protein
MYSIYLQIFLRNIFCTFLYHQSTSCIVCVVYVILKEHRTCLVFRILYAWYEFFFLTLRPDQSLFVYVCWRLLLEKEDAALGITFRGYIVTWSWYDLTCSHTTCSNKMRGIKSYTPQQPHSGLEWLLYRMTLYLEVIMSGFTSSMISIFHLVFFLFLSEWHNLYIIYGLTCKTASQ